MNTETTGRCEQLSEGCLDLRDLRRELDEKKADKMEVEKVKDSVEKARRWFMAMTLTVGVQVILTILRWALDK